MTGTVLLIWSCFFAPKMFCIATYVRNVLTSPEHQPLIRIFISDEIIMKVRTYLHRLIVIFDKPVDVSVHTIIVLSINVETYIRTYVCYMYIRLSI